MPMVFKNPQLPDYFEEVRGSDLPCIIEPFEQGRIIIFPDVRLDVDHGFWASLPVDGYPGLKKLKSDVSLDDLECDPTLEKGIGAAGLPPDLAADLKRAIRSVYEKVLPSYQKLFEGYRVAVPRVIWRLNPCINQNMHIDVGENSHLFARLFVNLDTQPRIWMTSFTIEELFRRYGDRVSGSHHAIRSQLNVHAFGGVAAWWTLQPKHTIYFEPGDMWALESRFIAHQIFYGRRAVSLDFIIDPASMRDPSRHFVAVIDRLHRPRQGLAGAT